MLYAWLSILVSVNALSLMLVFLGLPGNWMMVLSTCLFAWWKWDHGVFSVWTLIAIAAIALLGEVIEFLAGMFGARSSGASWQASVAAVFGAVLGALLGTFMIPVLFLGTVAGASVGAGLAVCVAEISRGQRAERSLRRGVGAGIGQLIGTTSKLGLGLVIWLIIAIAAFWP